MFQLSFLVALSTVSVVLGAFYSTYSGEEISPARFAEYQRVGTARFCGVEMKDCDPNEPRRLDYSCNNLKHPQRGTAMTPFRHLLHQEFDLGYRIKSGQSGKPLPNVRSVRTAALSDGRVPSKEHTHLILASLISITGDITSVHDVANYVRFTTTCCITMESDPVCIPIRIPDDDVHLRRSNVRCMNLTRAVTYQDFGCAPQDSPPERINTSPPMLDLSIIYGGNENTMQRARERQGGRLRTSTINGQEWPPQMMGSRVSEVCAQNQPPQELICHDTPTLVVNSLIAGNVVGMQLWRNHNKVARTLEVLNPCWDDDKLFRTTKDIMNALANQIYYYELFTIILGYDFLIKNKVIYETMGHVDDYDDSLIPHTSIEYVTGTRWFHTMQDGRFKMYDQKGSFLDEIPIVEMTLRTGILALNKTLEGLTQGLFRQACAAPDHVIDPDMGERVLGTLQFASDIMSVDMMKGRDAGLPPYYKYREFCGLEVPKDFDDLLHWMTVEQVDALKQHYERAADIDLMAGIMSEERMPGAITGPTLSCIMLEQLQHWRRADRFWYEHSKFPGAFTKEQLYQIRQITAARVFCDFGIDVVSIQPHAFYLPGPGNEIIDCKYIKEGPQFEPWKDDTCSRAKRNSTDAL